MSQAPLDPVPAPAPSDPPAMHGSSDAPATPTSRTTAETPARVRAPVPPRVELVRTLHGVDRADEYDWMRDAATLAPHLDRERAYYEAATAHTAALRVDLCRAMAARAAEVETSVEWREAGHRYREETPAGADYPCLLRRPVGARDQSRTGPGDGPAAGAWEVVLEPAALTDGSAHVGIGVREISPCGTLLAYSVDTRGDEVYELRFRDLTTGRDLPDRIPASYYTGAWSADSGAFWYTVPDRLHRPHEVRLHRLGDTPERDLLVHREDDARFELTVAATRAGRLVTVTAASRDTTEVWLVDATDPAAPARSVAGRMPGTEYRVDHDAEGDRLVVVTDRDAPESRLVTAPVPGHTRSADQARASADAWTDLHPARPGERLLRVDAFARHLVLTLRRDGAPLLRILPLREDGRVHELHPELPAGRIAAVHNHVYDTAELIVESGSYTEPSRWWSVDLDTGARRLLKSAQAPGHVPGDHVSERRWATASDGTRIPVTLAYRADTPLDGTAPCLMYAYGAYEAVDEPAFDPALAELLDRGVVFAHAHVRGGGELGRAWWQAGRLEAKATTFDDHLAVADWLADAGLVDGQRIATRGLSAGGLLQAAVYSRRPQRWACVVAEVPFVDVVTTMLDPDIPLTVNEWEEWGDPRRAQDFAWMLAYSPYDNPPPPDGRPPLLVTGAVHDPRVLVREPAKWVARLRATAGPGAGDRVLFRVETGEGAHAGPAGRHAHLRYEAEVLAFVLDAFEAVDRS